MDKKQVLEIYNRNCTEEDYFKRNVTFAFSKTQLEEAMEKLGAKDKSQLVTIFGYGDVCLKSKAKEIYFWFINREKEKKKWIKNLSTKEQNYIIEYELYNYECEYTYDIEPVVDLFEDIFEYNDIMRVFQHIIKQ